LTTPAQRRVTSEKPPSSVRLRSLPPFTPSHIATLCAEPAAAGLRLFRLVSACAPGGTPQLIRKVGARTLFAKSTRRSTLPVTHIERTPDGGTP
jgi:hypothetical protein